MGNSQTPMGCVLVSVIANVALDILFVGPLGWGTAGAAWATVISQALSFALCLGYLLRHRDLFSFARERLRLRWRKIRMILRLGIPCAVQMTVAGISWLVVTYLINDYGAVISAANAYSGKIKDLSGMFISATSSAPKGKIQLRERSSAADGLFRLIDCVPSLLGDIGHCQGQALQTGPFCLVPGFVGRTGLLGVPGPAV